MDHRPNTVARRKFLMGLSAVAALAFDPITRSWVTAANAAPPPHAGTQGRPPHAGTQGPPPHANANGLRNVPRLDGELLTDPASLEEMADDFGHHIHRIPRAVLRPGSIDDVVAMVKFCKQHNIEIAMRGQGHSTHGQAQVEAGIVIDSRTLDSVKVTGNSAVVGAGARWRQVLQATLPKNKTPPTLPNFLDLTVGGNIACGGIGGASHRYGAVIDNVEELWVVTGHGVLRRCSETSNPLLFNSVLAGLGQFGIVVQARIRLIEAKPMVRVYSVAYPDVSTFTADVRAVALSQRFDHLEAQVNPNDQGVYQTVTMMAAKNFHPNSPPNNQQLLQGVSGATVDVTDMPFSAFVTRIDPVIDFLKAAGAWDVPHPFFDVFLPSSTAPVFLNETFASVTAAETGNANVVLYPLVRSKFKRPLLRTPDGVDPLFFLFDILAFAPPVPMLVEAAITRNTDMHTRASQLGGKRYNIGSANISSSDWRDYFSPHWVAVVLAKLAYDPMRILTPGQEIFD